MQTLPQERRVSVRTKMLGVTGNVISNKGTKRDEIHAQDISEGGLRFELDAQYSAGETVRFEGETSDISRTLDISCDMEIVSVERMAAGKFLYGTRFLNLTKDQQVTLGIFIELMVTKFPTLLV
ncbi:MAG: PilZ domain-containing protein [Defluviitaleaceae bacterium]|nr:PilZ domain-containing protein [Defluviitaleaceae bacterium]MCL2262220.1 PilZ domain-containing protein [Defluviitaleaceae bacterium]